MQIIDLHTHTTASDGTLTPKQLMDYARVKKLSAIAITDHDTLDGILEAETCQPSEGYPELIPGIEFSTTTTSVQQDVHILGYYVDPRNESFISQLQALLKSRTDRNQKMVDRLSEVGLPITMADVEKNATDGVITRAHFAKALLEKGYIQKMDEAFTKYIGNGNIAYVPREKVTPKKAIQLIRSCGGVPVLAHPTLYHLDLRQLNTLIEELVSYGLLGIEGIYTLHTKSEERYIGDFAKQYHLVITGGSDYHGANKSGIDLGTGRGNLQVPYSLLEPIKALAGK